jgi:hypothetical protein
MVLAYLDVWQAARIVQNKTKHLEKHLGSTMYSDDDAVWIELDIYIYRYPETNRRMTSRYKEFR